MFLFFGQSEPQRSYKHGSYSKKGVYWICFLLFQTNSGQFLATQEAPTGQLNAPFCPQRNTFHHGLQFKMDGRRRRVDFPDGIILTL